MMIPTARPSSNLRRTVYYDDDLQVGMTSLSKSVVVDEAHASVHTATLWLLLLPPDQKYTQEADVAPALNSHGMR